LLAFKKIHNTTVIKNNFDILAILFRSSVNYLEFFFSRSVLENKPLYIYIYISWSLYRSQLTSAVWPIRILRLLLFSNVISDLSEESWITAILLGTVIKNLVTKPTVEIQFCRGNIADSERVCFLLILEQLFCGDSTCTCVYIYI